MDNKLASTILVALLVGASLAVFALSSTDEESKDDTKSVSYTHLTLPTKA